MQAVPFKRHRFPPEFIRHAVWLYARFTLSYRDVEDLLAEHGLDISCEHRSTPFPRKKPVQAATKRRV
jgi:putative transposase